MLKIKRFNSFCTTREMNEIDYNELIKLVNNGAILIDVRSPQEYKENHLKNAISIPDYYLKTRIEKIIRNKDKEIILYCTYGGRAKKGFNILKRLGYNNLYVLKGGLDEL